MGKSRPHFFIFIFSIEPLVSKILSMLGFKRWSTWLAQPLSVHGWIPTSTELVGSVNVGIETCTDMAWPNQISVNVVIQRCFVTGEFGHLQGMNVDRTVLL